jgi:hypothetical protein
MAPFAPARLSQCIVSRNDVAPIEFTLDRHLSARTRLAPLRAPVRAPGRRPSSASANGSSSCGKGSSPRLEAEIANREMVRSSRFSASTPRTRSTAISVSVDVAQIGTGNVSARVTARMSAKRTRTVTVRHGRSSARKRRAR